MFKNASIKTKKYFNYFFKKPVKPVRNIFADFSVYTDEYYHCPICNVIILDSDNVCI